MITVSFFSAGVSSAVATKLVIDQVDRIIYTHIDDQHLDTMRFVKDCEVWFGKEVEIIQSEYKCVDRACREAGGNGYINGANGAACTKRLKRDLRLRWQKQHEDEPLCFVWGIDYKERHRCSRLEKTMPMQEHMFPLVEHKISKTAAHQILTASGIKRPAMYAMGYLNNNCVGCVKGGIGYWNKIRRDFPDVFAARAIMEREIGATCLKDKSGRVYLDELDPERGMNQPPIVSDCGIFCELIGL